jgi:hypothetical protein
VGPVYGLKKNFLAHIQGWDHHVRLPQVIANILLP